jgi:hypothetical protein
LELQPGSEPMATRCLMRMTGGAAMDPIGDEER